jgi:hypothetical protein
MTEAAERRVKPVLHPCRGRTVGVRKEEYGKSSRRPGETRPHGAEMSEHVITDRTYAADEEMSGQPRQSVRTTRPIMTLPGFLG